MIAIFGSILAGSHKLKTKFVFLKEVSFFFPGLHLFSVRDLLS